MPRDISTIQPSYNLTNGTINFQTFFRMGWRDYRPKSPNRKSTTKGRDMPTVEEVGQLIQQFENRFPKKDIHLNWDSHDFNLRGSENQLFYGEWAVSHKFLYDFAASYCPRAGHDSFYRLHAIDPQFALDYLNKFVPRTTDKINQAIAEVHLVGKSKGWSDNRIRARIEKIKESGNKLILRQQNFGDDTIARAWNSTHFAQYNDSDLIIDMITEDQSIGKMKVFDCRLRENDLLLRFTPQNITQIQLRKQYPCISITNPELGGKSIYADGGFFEGTCWNGQCVNNREATLKQIHRGKMNLQLGRRIPVLIKDGKRSIKMLEKGTTTLFQTSQGTLDELFMKQNQNRREKVPRSKIESGFPSPRELFIDRNLRKNFTGAERRAIKSNLDDKSLTAPKNSVSRVIQAITLTAQNYTNRRQWEIAANDILAQIVADSKKPRKTTATKKLVIDV